MDTGNAVFHGEIADELNRFAYLSAEEKEAAFANLSFDAKLCIIYAEQCELRRYVTELEKKAEQMTSPDAMMGMVQKMMGGMF